MLKIQVIIGSTREGRFSEKPAQWIFEKLQETEGIEAELLDLRDYSLPFYNEPQSPSQLGEKYSNEVALEWVKKVAEGDAYVIVSPEYNHAPSAVLKNALDWVNKSFNKKPVGFVSYGSVGGARAVEQLRLIVNELQMASIRSAIHIPGEVYMKAKEGDQSAFEVLDERAKDFISQLIWWGEALKEARLKDGK